MNKKIRPIHSYGPKVGEWTVHATVAETIAREIKRLKTLQATQPSVIVSIKRKGT